MTKNKLIGCIRDAVVIFVCGLFFACMLYACASVGSPMGGPVDETPPHFVSSTPAPNSIDYNKNKIEIHFDELVTLDNPMNKVIITPPQTQFPVIKAIGKKVQVEIKDSLQSNTTYTIDFADAITDNNEKNVLENFTFAFSTGDVVDSLVVSGTLLNAQNLEPMPGILVGLHKNLDDTAFVKLPFLRTTKTNERGNFWIRNISPGTYRVYALNDLNRDYRFDQPGEEIAFSDSLIIPSFVPATRIDTIWKDSITVDTIIQTDYNRFIPDDVVLFLFKEGFEKQYLRKSERTNQHNFLLYFNAPVDSLPEIRFLNVENVSPDWNIIEYTEEKRTLNYWIKDSTIYNMDTLSIEVSYLKSDSLNLPVLTNDTLSLFMKRVPKKSSKKDKKNEEEKIEFLGVNIEASFSMDIFDSVKVKFSEPLLHFDSAYISLERKIDSVSWKPIKFSVIQNEMNPMQYAIYHKWEYGKDYRISIDSALFTGIYGKWNDRQETNFKVKAETEYGHLYVNISGIDGSGFGELLDGSDKVVRKSELKDGGLLFMNLKPSKYYLRYIADTNGNGKWDTGDYAKHLHPEQVFYYPAFFDIRSNWEVEENWNVTEAPVIHQKLIEITKNKPKEKKKNVNAQNAQNGRNNAQNSRFVGPGM